MEVHHHPQLKHEPKPWKEYILEYLMIVLAVDSCYLNAKEVPRYHYILLARWNTPVNEVGPGYKPTLPTIGQLKSSGNLRLLEDKE